jgi:uncharacterized protein with GYD domain
MDVVRPAVEAMGGRFVSFYWAFGEYDIVAIAEFPDNATAAGFSMAASAGGAVKAIKTTPLMTNEEAMTAMGKAGASSYRPPA